MGGVNSTIRHYAPGIALCVAGAAVSFALDRVLAGKLGFSSVLLIAIILGIAVGNFRPWGSSPGVRFTAMRVLKFGVVLLGLALPAASIIALGWKALAVIFVVVAAGFAASGILWRVMGLTREEGLLIGAGCSICGAAAIAAVSGVVPQKRQHEIVTAIAVVAVLGTSMIAIAPMIIDAAGFHAQAAGIFIGASTHEVSQVVAAGGIAGAAVLPVAVSVKLGRVLMLAPIMAILSAVERKNHDGSSKLPPLVPPFVAGFIALVLVRTFMPLPDWVISGSDMLRTWLFAASMFAQGMGVTFATIKAAGHKPFVFGLVVSIVVVGASYAGALVAQ